MEKIVSICLLILTLQNANAQLHLSTGLKYFKGIQFTEKSTDITKYIQDEDFFLNYRLDWTYDPTARFILDFDLSPGFSFQQFSIGYGFSIKKVNLIMFLARRRFENPYPENELVLGKGALFSRHIGLSPSYTLSKRKYSYTFSGKYSIGNSSDLAFGHLELSQDLKSLESSYYNIRVIHSYSLTSMISYSIYEFSKASIFVGGEFTIRNDFFRYRENIEIQVPSIYYFRETVAVIKEQEAKMSFLQGEIKIKTTIRF